jgi:hypothetical protein
MKIIAIDPGVLSSAYVILESYPSYHDLKDEIIEYGYTQNEQMQEVFGAGGNVRLYCENITPPRDRSDCHKTIETAKWVGRFQEQCQFYGLQLILINRDDVTDHFGCKKSTKFHKRPTFETQIIHKMEEHWNRYLDCMDSEVKVHLFQALALATMMSKLIRDGINEQYEVLL